MAGWIETIKGEFLGFSSRERRFVLFAMVASFLIAFEYAIARPVSNSLFLTAYGSSFLPYAWLSAVPLNLLLVSLYNKYLPRLGCLKIFWILATTVITTHLLSAFFLSSVPWLPFLFYVWREIYIMLMLQQLWSLIHLTIPFQRAKYLYGILFAVGALGALFGSLPPGYLAPLLGSETLLVSTLPLYLLLGLSYKAALKNTEGGLALKLTGESTSSKSGLLHGFKMTASSGYLLLILGIVVLMQFSTTLIDFQFNALLEQSIADKDLRTAYLAKVLGLTHGVALIAQLVGAFLFVQYLGLRRGHLVIPLFLVLPVLSCQLFPVLGIASFAYVSVKSCDFSLFTILKELLYLPLKPDEKFHAKAVIDVFAHRSSKALVSTLILGLQALLGSTFLNILGWSFVALFVLWALLVFFFLKEPALKGADEKPQTLPTDDAS